MKVNQPSENPYKYSYGTNKRYRTFDGYIKERFGDKCVKITLDGGFCCPNIDGSKSRGGCVFCTMPHDLKRELPAFSEQYKKQKAAIEQKWPGKRNIAYLSYYSGTYAPPGRLREVYDEALSLPDTAGLFVGTRPDCLGTETLDLISEYCEKTFFVPEVGVETMQDRTLSAMNRAHTAKESEEAMTALKSRNIPFCVHLIFGLPDESREDMIESTERIAAFRPDFIKIHMLYLSDKSALGRRYLQDPFPLLSKEEYVSTVCDAIERLPEDTVIERLTGDGLSGELIAPQWSRKKVSVINDIDKELYRRGSFQGMRTKERKEKRM